jgi:hypothetical protein
VSKLTAVEKAVFCHNEVFTVYKSMCFNQTCKSSILQFKLGYTWFLFTSIKVLKINQQHIQGVSNAYLNGASTSQRIHYSPFSLLGSHSLIIDIANTWSHNWLEGLRADSWVCNAWYMPKHNLWNTVPKVHKSCQLICFIMTEELQILLVAYPDLQAFLDCGSQLHSITLLFLICDIFPICLTMS